MIKNFFINAFRNMRKQRGYLLLNVGGLAIGLTSFLFITLYVCMNSVMTGFIRIMKIFTG